MGRRQVAYGDLSIGGTGAGRLERRNVVNRRGQVRSGSVRLDRVGELSRCARSPKNGKRKSTPRDTCQRHTAHTMKPATSTNCASRCSRKNPDAEITSSAKLPPHRVAHARKAVP